MNEYYLIHQNRYKYIIDRILDLKLPKGAKILDVGCYPMDLFRQLQTLGFTLSGISSEHEKVKEKGVVTLNIETDKLPFEKESFDLILFSEVMEHMLHSPAVYLEKFREVLKTNGFLLITTPNAVHIKHRLELLTGKNLNFPLFQFEGSVYHRHNREYTISEIKELLEKAKFRICKMGHFNAYSPFRKKLHKDSIQAKIGKGIVYVPTFFFPELRDTLFVLAQKC